MRILALGILLLAMCGCATAAEQEMARMRDTSERVGSVVDNCWSRAQAQDAYAALSNKVILKSSVSPTLVQRIDASKPTADERRILGDFHRDWLTPCRTAVIEGSVAILPALRPAMLRYGEREDDVYTALMQGRLTWGEANSQLLAVRHETAKAVYEITSQVAQDLRRQHDQEQERRAAAVAAVGEALVHLGAQQMEAERLRQWQAQQSMPRHTMCQNVGGMVSCTTY
jgi:hypothetical protein